MIEPEPRDNTPVLWTLARMLKKTRLEWKSKMCPEYYRMYLKFCELCDRAEEEGRVMNPPSQPGPQADEHPLADNELTQAAIAEIKQKMSAHIKGCPVCQDAMKWLKGGKV